ncbi:hypothetical protein COO60DRAFT_1489783 [Scenedesmus sp. NREL 46B-D3]|nr:hypothetical protein COO60DRAFT_1489783 [Scenedesmus sp. NREL 46B-D3]
MTRCASPAPTETSRSGRQPAAAEDRSAAACGAAATPTCASTMQRPATSPSVELARVARSAAAPPLLRERARWGCAPSTPTASMSPCQRRPQGAVVVVASAFKEPPYAVATPTQSSATGPPQWQAQQSLRRQRAARTGAWYAKGRATAAHWGPHASTTSAAACRRKRRSVSQPHSMCWCQTRRLRAVSRRPASACSLLVACLCVVQSPRTRFVV